MFVQLIGLLLLQALTGLRILDIDGLEPAAQTTA